MYLAVAWLPKMLKLLSTVFIAKIARLVRRMVTLNHASELRRRRGANFRLNSTTPVHCPKMQQRSLHSSKARLSRPLGSYSCGYGSRREVALIVDVQSAGLNAVARAPETSSDRI